MRCTLHRENQSDVTRLKSKCQACFEPELVKRLVFWAMAALVRFSELTMLRFQDCSYQSCDKSSARRKENTRVSKNEKWIRIRDPDKVPWLTTQVRKRRVASMASLSKHCTLHHEILPERWGINPLEFMAAAIRVDNKGYHGSQSCHNTILYQFHVETNDRGARLALHHTVWLTLRNNGALSSVTFWTGLPFLIPLLIDAFDWTAEGVSFIRSMVMDCIPGSYLLCVLALSKIIRHWISWIIESQISGFCAEN